MIMRFTDKLSRFGAIGGIVLARLPSARNIPQRRISISVLSPEGCVVYLMLDTAQTDIIRVNSISRRVGLGLIVCVDILLPKNLAFIGIS